MKFQSTADALREALHHTQPVTTKHSSLPVLAQTLFIIQKDSVVVRTTNLSIGVEYRISAKTEGEGSFACSGALLQDIIAGAVADEIITIEQSGNLITFSTEHQQSTIKTVPHDDFPALPKIEQANQFLVSAQDLSHTIKSVIYAASSSDIKPEISSVYMYSDQGNIVMVATDSFRLAEKKLLIPNLPDITGCMIPVKNAAHIMRSCADMKDTSITIQISPTQITFSTSSWYCVSRLVDGNYPDYRQIIPTESSTKMVLLRSDIMNALRTLNLFADTFQQVDISIDPTTKTCSMIAENVEIGRTTIQIPAALSGENIETRCNGRYLQDCMGALSADSVCIGFVAPNKPITVRPVGDDDFLYLVMPMHRTS